MPARRRGLTLVELLAVLAVLAILAAVLGTGLRRFGRDADILAAADTVRGRIADARAEAIGHGLAYRLAVSADGTRVRVAPDDLTFDAPAEPADEAAPRVVEDELPKGVTAASQPPDGSPPLADADGWTRVATFQPDGTCREDAAVVRLTQPNIYPILVRVRGLTGAASVEPQKTAPGASP